MRSGMWKNYSSFSSAWTQFDRWLKSLTLTVCDCSRRNCWRPVRDQRRKENSHTSKIGQDSCSKNNRSKEFLDEHLTNHDYEILGEKKTQRNRQAIPLSTWETTRVHQSLCDWCRRKSWEMNLERVVVSRFDQHESRCNQKGTRRSQRKEYHSQYHLRSYHFSSWKWTLENWIMGDLKTSTKTLTIYLEKATN